MGFAYNIIADKVTAISTKERANFLLSQGEDKIPPRVVEALDFLDDHDIWYIVSRNTPATSCRDASSRRNRLGSIGIPLHDELKSHCLVFYNRKGEREYIILHCRGDMRFDLVGLEKTLGASRPLARMANEELERVFGSEYGTVTPFVLMDNLAMQIFDEEVFKSHFPPHTMMTNAGNHTWAIEFKAIDLFNSLKKAYPEKIIKSSIVESKTDTTWGKDVRFGIITGNGPESGMALWRHLNRNVVDELGKDFKGDLSYPSVIVHSIPEMGLSMELEPRELDVWKYLSRGVHQLCKSGVTHLALACHTTHFFTDRIREICEKYGAEFISMADIVTEHIRTNGITDITIIGIPYVSDLREWSAYSDLSSLNIQTVDARARERLLDLGYHVKKCGSDARGLNKLNQILKMGVNTNHVLIALTEISVLLGGFDNTPKPLQSWKIIDPLRLYGQHMAKIFSAYSHEGISPTRPGNSTDL